MAGNSGVAAYRLGEHSITIQFTDGPVYLYTYTSTGEHHIEQMKTLARAGKGLATYINTFVRGAYAARLA